MKTKQIIKIATDAAKTILLPILMAFMLTGQQAHEWIGTGMIVLFIIHHLLNTNWIKSLFKGKYTLSRIFGTVLNILLCADMISLAVSGIIMSGFVFSFLPIHGGMVFARQLHMLSSYWGFVLMSAHLGFHWSMIVGMGRKMFRLTAHSVARTWALRIMLIAVSVYGVYAFIEQNLLDYLFLKNAFVFFDFEKPAALFFFEYNTMMCLFAAIAYYINKTYRQRLPNTQKDKNKWIELEI